MNNKEEGEQEGVEDRLEKMRNGIIGMSLGLTIILAGAGSVIYFQFHKNIFW